MDLNQSIKALENLSNKKVILIEHDLRDPRRMMLIEKALKGTLTEGEQQLLQEDLKSLFAGILLLTAGMASPNLQAQVKQDLGNPNVVAAAKQVVDNPNELNTVVDGLVKQGYKGKMGTKVLTPQEIKAELQQNIKIAEANLQKKNPQVRQQTADESNIARFVKSNWVVTGATAKTIYDTIRTYPAPLIDTTSFTFDGDQLFNTGEYTLKPEIVDSLKQMISGITAQNGIIVDIDVAGGTSKLPVNPQGKLAPKLLALGLTADNAGLTKARNMSITNVLQQVGVPQGIIHTSETVEGGQGINDPNARFVTITILAQRIVQLPAGGNISVTETIKFQYTVAHVDYSKKTTPPKPPHVVNVKVSHLAPGQCAPFGR